MMILAEGTASLMARHASMPDCFGIRTSSSTTSGAAVAASSAPSSTVAGLAHDLDAGLDGEQHGQTAPEELLVVDDEDPDGLRPRCVGPPRRIMTRLGGMTARRGHRRAMWQLVRVARTGCSAPAHMGYAGRGLLDGQSRSSEITP